MTSPVSAGILSSDAGDSRHESPYIESTLDDPRLDVVAPEEAGMQGVRMAPAAVSGDRRAAESGRDAPATARELQRSSPDALSSTLRGLVNVAPGNSGGGGPARTATARGAGAATATAPGERDEALEARIDAVKEALADGIQSALSPEVDERGKVSFSVLGVEGFHADASDGKVSVGFRDVGFEPVIRSPGSYSSGYPNDPSLHPRQPDEGERLALFRFVFAVWDIITHPMTLGLLAFALVLRVALAIGRIKRMPMNAPGRH